MESYLDDMDFHALYKEAVEKANRDSEPMINGLSDEIKSDPELFEQMTRLIQGRKFSDRKKEAEQQFLDKRPELARKQYRETLTNMAQQAAIDIPVALGFEPKGKELQSKFRRLKYWDSSTDTNDALVVKALNKIVSDKYGAVKNRQVDQLRLSLKYMEESIKKMRSNLGCDEK